MGWLSGKPKWYNKFLSSMYSLNDNEIQRLESLRLRLNLDHMTFALGFAGCRTVTRRVQESKYGYFKERFPEADERKLLLMVLESRLATYESESVKYAEVASIFSEQAKRIKNLDDAINVIIEAGERYNSLYWQNLINAIDNELLSTR
jgi:hypothetical protein